MVKYIIFRTQILPDYDLHLCRRSVLSCAHFFESPFFTHGRTGNLVVHLGGRNPSTGVEPTSDSSIRYLRQKRTFQHSVNARELCTTLSRDHADTDSICIVRKGRR